MQKSFEDIVSALRKSVADHVRVAAPDATEAVLEQITAFEAELAKAVEAITPAPPAEVTPLGRFAGVLQDMEAAVLDIEAGRCAPVAEGFAPSEEAVDLCKTVVDLGQVALHAMALDFAAPIADGEQPSADETLVKVADADGEILVKTLLPRQEAEILLRPPTVLATELGAIALDLLTSAGISPQQLAKAFPAKKKAEGEDEAEGAEDEGEEEGEAEGAEDEGAEGEDEEGYDEDEPGGGDGTPLENVVKLSTGIMIELEELLAKMPPEPDSMAASDPAGGDAPEGDAGAGEAEEGVIGAVQAMTKMAALIAMQADALQAAVDSADDAEADAYAEKVAKACELAKALVPRVPVVAQAEGESLTKRATDAEAEAARAKEELGKAREQLDALVKRVEAMGRLPAPAKGAAMDVTGVVPKVADQGGAAEPDPALQAAELMKAGRESDATLLLLKHSLSRPIGGPPR